MPDHKKPRRSPKVSAEEKCRDRHCETIKQYVPLKDKNHHCDTVCVEKTVCCDTVHCEGCEKCVPNRNVPVKVQNAKIYVKEGDRCTDTQKVDIYLKREKGKDHKIPVHIEVDAPSVCAREQRIDVFVEEGKDHHKKPRVRVHCPEAACHNVCVVPKVHVKRPEPVCIKSHVYVHYVKCGDEKKKCKK